MIQGLLILNYPAYESHAYHGTFFCWAVIAVSVFINTVVSGLLPMLEGVILIIHVLGFLAILITLLYTAPHGTAASVFTVSLNEGKWPTQGLSYCVGFIGNVATFVGEFLIQTRVRIRSWLCRRCRCFRSCRYSKLKCGIPHSHLQDGRRN